jgi:hypothetical protein
VSPRGPRERVAEKERRGEVTQTEPLDKHELKRKIARETEIERRGEA